MIVYTVHEPGHPAQSIDRRADDITLVKEGFTWFGFLIPPLWLFVNRLWIELIATLAVTGLATLLLTRAGYAEAVAGTIVSLFVSLVVGFEGNDLKRWRLERKGYAFLASVAGRDFDECERRFFDAWLPHIQFRGATPTSGPMVDLRPPPPPRDSDWRGPSIIGTLPGLSV